MQEQEIEVENESFVNNINFDYNPLKNKPSINDTTLEGNKTLHDLGIQPEGEYITKDVDDLTNYKTNEELDGLLQQKADKTALPKNLSELNNDVGFIKKDAIPTKNSQLQNDSGFITTNEIPTNVSDFENDANYAKVNQIPTSVSDLTNDTGFITKLVEDLVNYYKKAETYTKDEVNKLIESIRGANFKKVDVRPETGEKNIIYFVPSTQPQEDNYYDEFVYFEDKWEKIGTTKIDFSNYTDNDQLKALLANYVTNETFQKELQNKLDLNSSGYIKKLSIDGKTITYTRGDGTEDTLETKDTTYQEATSSSSGLMSAQDKSKLDTLVIPKNVSDLVNDSGFITEYTETDPTVPSHVKSITANNISSWNNKAETSAIPTKLSQLTNDMFVKCQDEDEAKAQSAGDTTHLYYWVEE